MANTHSMPLTGSWQTERETMHVCDEREEDGTEVADTAPVRLCAHCVTCQVCACHWHLIVPTPTSMMELCFFCDVAPSSSTAGLQEVPATEAATVICSALLLEPDEVVGYTTMGRPPMMDALHNKIQQDTTRVTST